MKLFSFLAIVATYLFPTSVLAAPPGSTDVLFLNCPVDLIDGEDQNYLAIRIDYSSGDGHMIFDDAIYVFDHASRADPILFKLSAGLVGTLPRYESGKLELKNEGPYYQVDIVASSEGSYLSGGYSKHYNGKICAPMPDPCVSEENAGRDLWCGPTKE